MTDEPPPNKILEDIILIVIFGLFAFGVWAVLWWNALGTEPPEIKTVQSALPTIGGTSLIAISPLPIFTTIKTFGVIATAYNALPEQTDSTPFITASGERVRVGIIAANWLPFGAELKINGQIYIVKDRMSKKYDYPHIDIFMWELEEAKEFGVRELEVELVN